MNNKDFWEAVRELSPKLFMTYSVIYKLSDNEVGYCYARNKSISEKIGKSIVRVSGDIGELKKLGYLNTIEINKKGNYCEERRIYTNNNYKTFLEDSKKIKKLIKTTTEIKNNVIYFYNERNQVKTVPNRGIVKNDNRGIVKNDYVTNTNTNLTNITTTSKDKKNSSSSLELIFKKHNFKISEVNLKNIEKLNLQESKIEEYLKYTISEKKGIGFLIKALKENWDITKPKEKSESKPKKIIGITHELNKNGVVVKKNGVIIEKTGTKTMETSEFKSKKRELLKKLVHIKDYNKIAKLGEAKSVEDLEEI